MIQNDFPIEELELGVRAYNILKRMGVNTYNDLMLVGPHELQEWYDNYTQSTGAKVAICGRTLQEITDAQLMHP